VREGEREERKKGRELVVWDDEFEREERQEGLPAGERRRCWSPYSRWGPR
jgi:hypothetical protein